MSRDDSALWSGATSASFARRKQRNEEILSQQLKFVKNAKYVFEEIELEKKRLGEVLNSIVTGEDHEEEVLVKLFAVRLHRKWLLELEKKLKIVLRARPIREIKEKEVKDGSED